MFIAIAFLIIGLAAWFLINGEDVRLVLFTAGFALASLALKPWAAFDVFLNEMGNGKTIGPICSAMGYAFVLKATGCDREMVRMLLSPIRRVKWLLIPGGCAVGFVTNIAITSQTAAAAAVGPVLVPLMLAAGYHPIIAAATLVLGCSGGGSLYNPGDADLVAIQENSKAPMSLALDAMFLPLLLGFSAAVAAFMLFSRREPIEAIASQPFAEIEAAQRINFLKASLPPLPIVMIFVTLPNFKLFPPLLKLYANGLPVSHAMLVSTMLALLIYRKEVSKQARSFFEGMGYAYVHVISLIIAASCFIAGMTEVGLTEKLVSVVHGSGFAAMVASGFFPWLLAVLSGTGIGPCVAFCKAVLPSLSQTDLRGAVDLGVLASIAATFGRTMSPVAAVVIFTASLVNVTPLQIVKRTGPALAVGAVVVLVVISIRRSVG